MPAKSERQRRFFGMELGKKRRGEKTDVDMSESQLSDFARKGKRKGKRKHKRGSSRK